ncbi:uncharacterized protein BO87DRAFT_396732 [Aspergillus neoniger CBS 115656]|uniref:Uncharacterized protein n=1 Tax=Aspergillus neoniger (strain CBS 115656) TaxID=1448310 RepID=A0A318YQT9_ASPNB|nr:hypothetical protein BO87DRAFT_396732 [Aspergillus neoniger CBS 115656]PYH34450.1 hypothetical protein BO87DRAFT_396732 [Aspergillus neoniger CBS 115656]
MTAGIEEALKRGLSSDRQAMMIGEIVVVGKPARDWRRGEGKRAIPESKEHCAAGELIGMEAVAIACPKTNLARGRSVDGLRGIICTTIASLVATETMVTDKMPGTLPTQPANADWQEVLEGSGIPTLSGEQGSCAIGANQCAGRQVGGGELVESQMRCGGFSRKWQSSTYSKRETRSQPGCSGSGLKCPVQPVPTSGIPLPRCDQMPLTSRFRPRPYLTGCGWLQGHDSVLDRPMIHGPHEDLTAGLRVESNHQLGTKNLTLAASATNASQSVLSAARQFTCAIYCIASAGTCEQRQFSGWCASPMQITAWSQSQPNPGKSGACSVPGMQSVQLSHRVTWATSLSFSVGLVCPLTALFVSSANYGHFIEYLREAVIHR